MSDDRLKRAEALVVKYATGWDNLPSGWTQESFKKFWNTLTEESAHPWTKCVEKMTGNIDDPEAFCASAKDQALGRTDWRGEKSARWGDPGDWYLDEVDDFTDDSNFITAEDEDSDKEAFTPSRRKGPTKKMDPREKRQQQMRRNRMTQSDKTKQQKRERKLEERRPGTTPSQRRADLEREAGTDPARLAKEVMIDLARMWEALKEAEIKMGVMDSVTNREFASVDPRFSSIRDKMFDSMDEVDAALTGVRAALDRANRPAITLERLLKKLA